MPGRTSQQGRRPETQGVPARIVRCRTHVTVGPAPHCPPTQRPAPRTVMPPGHIIQDGLVKGVINSPTAQRTIFGWIISGPCGFQPNPNLSSSAPCGLQPTPVVSQSYHVSLDRELFEVLSRFWELEDIPCSSRSLLSTEHHACEDHFQSTHSRDENGRYIVRLPFKDSRVLWFDQSDNITAFQLTTVTYGLACALFLALRTLLQLVKDHGDQYPLAVPSLTKGRYVDDIFGGADSIQQAQEIVTQLNNLCMAGGFPLQKWFCNHPDILAFIRNDKKILSSSVAIEDNTMVNILGLFWQPLMDTFQFQFKNISTGSVTKRSILSTIAKCFDPLGFLSPISIKAKILLQELWSLKLEWDDPLPPPLSAEWINFLQDLQEISSLTFPRWLGSTSDTKLEIHGFCDASQRAMAAVVYLRATSPDGNTKVTLVCAKTKVAPLKRLTIPRLELAGAVLLTKLTTQVIQVLELQSAPIYLWTDSSVTYTWISQHPSKWKEFVQNRVCFIQETLPHALWKFVSGKENPADLATRGLLSVQLKENPGGEGKDGGVRGSEVKRPERKGEGKVEESELEWKKAQGWKEDKERQ
ncbi:PREDICTED: uncharacterized protein LOC105557140 [Vollenhovia emeryi]|uniref:uncharacterized protein LOC105557140 n=1 Tax=Vollenhovia emeryi TaxID=411798 RepID=UPI0005F4BE64|nr:PREDICTED: uncharacterized protein LOC105557140 [Vollenhovia emeryi]